MKVFAPWCRACKGLEPKFNAIVKDEKYKGLPVKFADLTIQHNKDYVKSIGVLALPTIQFYSHGGLVDNFPCGPSKVPILKSKLAQLIEDSVDMSTMQLQPAGSVGPVINEMEKQVTKPVNVQETMTYVGKGITEKQQQILEKIPYLMELSDEDRLSVLTKAKLLTFEPNSVIMREGNPGRTFYVITDGEVEICQKTFLEDPLTTPSSYLGTVINRFSVGEFFGERALITGEPRAASIRAGTSQVKCLAFDMDDFPATSVLSGKVDTTKLAGGPLDDVNDRYGVSLKEISTSEMSSKFKDISTASQVRGSVNNPRAIKGIDTDDEISDDESFDPEVVESAEAVYAPAPTDGEMTASAVVPLLLRFKLIRLVSRGFDYIMSTRPALGQRGARKRRNMLVQLLEPWQKVEINNAYNLIDLDSNGSVTLNELRRVMESIGEEKSDRELEEVIERANGVDGKQVITHEDFLGLMAEAEFYHLFLDTFTALDKFDSGFVKAGELDRVLCGVRDLISDDRKSIIDVEDKEILINYEQFSRMLLGTALK